MYALSDCSADGRVRAVSAAGEAAPRIKDIFSVENVRANIVPLSDWTAVEAAFAEDQKNPGWVDVAWSRPTGAALEVVVERLKALKLTIRNAPNGQTGHPDAPCIFTGAPVPPGAPP